MHRGLPLSPGRYVRIAQTISIAITIAGILLVAVGTALDVGPLLPITGMFLIVAGVVKVGMVVIWKNLFARPLPVQQIDTSGGASSSPDTEG